MLNNVKERRKENETVAMILIRKERKLPDGELSDCVVRKKLKRGQAHCRK